MHTTVADHVIIVLVSFGSIFIPILAGRGGAKLVNLGFLDMLFLGPSGLQGLSKEQQLLAITSYHKNSNAPHCIVSHPFSLGCSALFHALKAPTNMSSPAISSTLSSHTGQIGAAQHRTRRMPCPTSLGTLSRQRSLHGLNTQALVQQRCDRDVSAQAQVGGLGQY